MTSVDSDAASALTFLLYRFSTTAFHYLLTDIAFMSPTTKALTKGCLQFKTDQSLYVTGNKQGLLGVQQFSKK